MNIWMRWARQPQTLWLRKALFQVHLWAGIALAVYIIAISMTGSLLVYRNELYRAATPAPLTVQPSGPRLSDDGLRAAVLRAYPGARVTRVLAGRRSSQPVDVSIAVGNRVKQRLFDPYTGRDLGNSVPLGIWFVSTLMDLHDNLLGGRTGRQVNGVGAVLVIVLAMTGLVIWWPGIKTWRRGLIVHRRIGWTRWIWELHGMMGVWSLAFIVLFGVTGLYLSYPAWFSALADAIQVPTDANAGTRAVDDITYWLAYLHFGRLGGRVPHCGRGFCDSVTKAMWAFFGLVPTAMSITGVIMWWNRIVRPRVSAHPSKRARASSLQGGSGRGVAVAHRTPARADAERVR